MRAINIYYRLDEKKNVVPCSLMEFTKQFGDDSTRRVALTKLKKLTVSTVFLGLDHNWGPEDATPIVFETMIFGEPKFEEYEERCCTWNEALEMHETALHFIKKKRK